MATSSPASEDVEKAPRLGGNVVDEPDLDQSSDQRNSSDPLAAPSGFSGKFGSRIKRFEHQLLKYNVEARGVQRVAPNQRHPISWIDYTQALFLWVSVNLAAINITLGMLAPAVYGLSFKDGALCAAFGSLLGSLAPAYIATWGPISGNRTMIITRYIFGWWPSKLIVILNIIVLLGYSLIDLVVAGQILSAVSTNGSLSVVVGIIIVAIIAWVISTFGIKVFYIFMRWAWLPQLIAISILYGVSASQYDLSTPSSGDARTIAGNRLSFFSLCFAAAVTYAGEAADYFVYWPPTTPRLPLFLTILTGLVPSFSFAIIVGIGLASAIPNNPAYSSAYNSGQGNLIVEGFTTLGKFGKFLGVIIALGLIPNVILPTYSSGIDFQILGRAAEKVPRIVWNTCCVIIYTVCALAGRDNLSEIFTNFLALMGYWVAIWMAVTLEEQLIFRRRRGYDWTVWNQPDKLPLGIAALIAFLVGWAGAILCMAQKWYIGPIAARVGEYGADMGNYVGFSWAALVYPPLRWLELRRFGR
ncbi:Vitamin B6 transporter [Lecanora helva]